MKADFFIGQSKSEMYGFIDFLANMGGLTGLFTGLSIVSVFEVIYFAFRAFKIMCKRENKVKLEGKTSA